MMRVGGVDGNSDVCRVENVLAILAGVHLIHTEAPKVIAITVADIDDSSRSQKRDEYQRCQVRANDHGANAAGARGYVVLAAMDSPKYRRYAEDRHGNDYEKLRKETGVRILAENLVIARREPGP